MIGMAQGAQHRSRASRGWLAALALGVALAFSAAPAFAGPAATPDLAKKKDGLLEKAATGDKARKDDALEKDVVVHWKSGSLADIKVPETKTGDERKKP